jgi:KDO2-lipid IV(A) lauroyltransferase
VLGYRPFGIRKRVVEKQIAAAFPELSHEAVTDLARQSYAHLGRTFVESALFDKLGKQGVLDIVDDVEDWHHIDEAVAQGKGIVFVTGHIGNWELAGAYVAAREFRSTRSPVKWQPLTDEYITGSAKRRA